MTREKHTLWGILGNGGDETHYLHVQGFFFNKREMFTCINHLLLCIFILYRSKIKGGIWELVKEHPTPGEGSSKSQQAGGTAATGGSGAGAVGTLL